MKTIENILMHNNLTKNMIAMKKIKTIMWLTLTFSVLVLVSCSKTNDDTNTNTDNQHVIISDDGKASNGSIFSNIDDKNFYLDYIKYTVTEGHLAVTGYDKMGFKGTANIVSCTTPPNISGNHTVFDTETYEKATLYVPRGFTKAYNSQTEWMKFKNIVEE